jgi:hypothetical protein
VRWDCGFGCDVDGVGGEGKRRGSCCAGEEGKGCGEVALEGEGCAVEEEVALEGFRI